MREHKREDAGEGMLDAPATALVGLRQEYAHVQAQHEHLGERLVGLSEEVQNAHLAVYAGHDRYEANLNRMKRHWQTAKHFSSLTGIMAAFVVAKILWATAVNLGEDNLDRDLAGTLAAISGFAGGMCMLAAYIHFRKGDSVRQKLLAQQPTLVRSTFNGSMYYPLSHSAEPSVSRPLLSDVGDGANAAKIVVSNPHVFVTPDNRAWIEARTSLNQRVTAGLMVLLGAAIGAGGCMAFTGLYNMAGGNSSQAQELMLTLGVTMSLIGGIMHCAAVDRWQRLPDQLGGELSDGLLQDPESLAVAPSW